MVFLFIFIISLVLQFFLPWWIIGLVAFGVAGFKAKSAGNAFSSGFLAIFILWIIAALFQSIPNHHILANRVGQMFMLPDTAYTWLIVLVLTGIIGGITAGFAALAGFYFRKSVNRN